MRLKGSCQQESKVASLTIPVPLTSWETLVSMVAKIMFGFKKKRCSVCQVSGVINVGKPLGHLCQKHMLDSYKTKFLGHEGRKIIIPPTPPNKYTSYQFETIASLRSYGLSANDTAPAKKLFSELSDSECYVMQSRYEAQDFLNLGLFGNANWKQKSRADAIVFILSALPAYINSNGIALPPVGNDDIIIYPLRSWDSLFTQIKKAPSQEPFQIQFSRNA